MDTLVLKDVMDEMLDYEALTLSSRYVERHGLEEFIMDLRAYLKATGRINDAEEA